MKTRKVKAIALATMAGGTMLGSGCLWGNDTWWGKLIWDGVIYAGYEYVLDNDGVWDLWEDGNVVVAE